MSGHYIVLGKHVSSPLANGRGSVSGCRGSLRTGVAVGGDAGGAFGAVATFGHDVADHVVGLRGMQFRVEALEGDAHDVAMMELVAGAALAQLEPEAMEQVYIFGPEAGRVRAEVEEALCA